MKINFLFIYLQSYFEKVFEFFLFMLYEHSFHLPSQSSSSSSDSILRYSFSNDDDLAVDDEKELSLFMITKFTYLLNLCWVYQRFLQGVQTILLFRHQDALGLPENLVHLQPRILLVHHQLIHRHLSIMWKQSK